MSEVVDVLVVGSGAGGAVTAALLAEAGHDVVVLEDGPWVEPGTHTPFSVGEMRTQYRNGGLTVALGRTPIAYVEGRCVGGGTEINSGLFHRPPGGVLDEWRDRFGVVDCDEATLAPHVERVEEALSVSTAGEAVPGTSAVLRDGAAKLGWHAVEVPRVFRYAPDAPRGVKQTMTRTFVPRAVAAGAEIRPGWRATQLVVSAGRVRAVVGSKRTPHGGAEPVRIEPRDVFLCGGAIQTAALLRGSGIRRNVGSLRLHPTVKLAARFPFALDGTDDVPMHQVKEFAPELTMGGSASRPGYVALSLSDAWTRNAARMAEADRIAVYYASIHSDGSGRVRALPGLAEPVVSYRLDDRDVVRLASGLVRLGELLFAAGAVELYPSVTGAPPVTDRTGLDELARRVTRANLNLMSVHLFSTVPMGEDRSMSGADSFGRVWGVENLRVNDASLLPDAPGVNPQGTIMAIASRNCERFLAAP